MHSAYMYREASSLHLCGQTTINDLYLCRHAFLGNYSLQLRILYLCLEIMSRH